MRQVALLPVLRQLLSLGMPFSIDMPQTIRDQPRS